MNNLFNTTFEDQTKYEIKPLQWKEVRVPNYEIDTRGVLYYYGKPCKSWKVNGRNYYSVLIDNHRWQYRADYMVGYTFLRYYEDAIRLVHIDGNIDNDNLSNLMWYRKVDVIKEYQDMAIVESDGSLKEEWKPCKLDYPCNTQYEVSNFGMIRDANTKELTQLKESHGYRVFYYIDPSYANTTRVKSVHRAVAEAFIPNPNKYELVNHLDGDKFNDMIMNLEWASAGMNMEHAYLQHLNNKSRYNEHQIRVVCTLLATRNISHVQISYMTGVDRKTISDIFRGRRWKDVSSEYCFQIKKWNSSMKEEVCQLIIEGKKGREIFAKLNIPYDQSAISFYERMRRELKRDNKIS